MVFFSAPVKVLVFYFQSVLNLLGSVWLQWNLWLRRGDLPRSKRIEMFTLKQTSRISKDWHESKCVPYGETTQVEERKDCFLLTVCTCNSHRLSEEWREPGRGALSALMMRSSGGHFAAEPGSDIETLTVDPAQSPRDKDGWHFLTIRSNLIRWFYWANAIISLSLGCLPRRATVESSLWVKNGLSLRQRESFFYLMKIWC